MQSTGSVTKWIHQLKSGDVTALAKLHKRYWPFLTRLADKKLKGASRRVADEEDVAQEALLGFYESLRRGSFPQLTNRHDLLAVLALITARKAAHQIERTYRKKRGAGRVQGESALDLLLQSGRPARGLEQVADEGPTPEEQAILADCYEGFVNALPERFRPYAKLYLAGHTYREIAEALGCVTRTVERKIPLILQRWQSLAERAMDSPQAP